MHVSARIDELLSKTSKSVVARGSPSQPQTVSVQHVACAPPCECPLEPATETLSLGLSKQEILMSCIPLQQEGDIVTRKRLTWRWSLVREAFCGVLYHAGHAFSARYRELGQAGRHRLDTVKAPTAKNSHAIDKAQGLEWWPRED